MCRGELVHLVQGEREIPCRVETGWHEGVDGVVFAVRRLTDGQRLICFSDGSLVEVPG